MKQYYHIVITRKDGTTYENPLTLSEGHFIPKMARDNKKISVEFREASAEWYKLTFGK